MMFVLVAAVVNRVVAAYRWRGYPDRLKKSRKHAEALMAMVFLFVYTSALRYSFALFNTRARVLFLDCAP